jgi:hypothetical protein
MGIPTRLRLVIAGDYARSAEAVWLQAPISGFFRDVAPSDVDQVVLAITLDREDVPVGILEPGDFAAAGAG